MLARIIGNDLNPWKQKLIFIELLLINKGSYNKKGIDWKDGVS